jgi:hypothetical protein
MSERDGVLHVTFRQSAGQLAGECWCGRGYRSDDPKDMWWWLDEHPHAGENPGTGRG